MPRERSIETFVLKRQDYGEADQIITLFSKEEGKVRALVKASKLPTSKLQPVLQPLFESRVTLSGGNNRPGLSKVIGAQLVKAYSGILDNESKLGAWYVASEFIIRALPDSAPNLSLFQELQKFANFLHSVDLTADQVKHSITQFQIKSLATLGLGIKTVVVDNTVGSVWFSLSQGGYSLTNFADSVSVSGGSYDAFQKISTAEYQVLEPSEYLALEPLHHLVNRFVAYHLEREIKSQKFMSGH